MARQAANEGSAALVTVYWRPGCPFCMLLRRGLRRAGIATTEVNIWQDHEAAATVRSFADGNETVPTVVVGTTGLVNPTVSAVRHALADTAPALAATLVPTRPRWRRFGWRGVGADEAAR